MTQHQWHRQAAPSQQQFKMPCITNQETLPHQVTGLRPPFRATADSLGTATRIIAFGDALSQGEEAQQLH
jgi:hypothetical protein